MTAVVAIVTSLAMEPLTYGAHRWVMHGVGWALHRSHHRRLATRFEANDVFPVVFAALAIIGFVAAINWVSLLPVCWGVTAYGAAYFFVHDVYIHKRVRLPRRLFSFLEPLRRAHLVHHSFNNEPYGMLLPIVPAHLRERADRRAAPVGR